MTPGKLNRRILADRLDWIDRMLQEINSLPMGSYEEFSSDTRNIWTAESCLRRALEALLDMGRHILAKGFGTGVTEYKQIARELGSLKVLETKEAKELEVLAGYRNRMVHFYHEIGPEELYKICRDDLGDIENLKDAFRHWVKRHPELMNDEL